MIGDLIKVAHRLAPLAVQAAHRQTELLQGLKDLLDILRQDQAGQVQHHADSDAGADVRGTGGQIAQALIESVRDFLLHEVIDPVDLLPAVIQSKSAVNDLDAQVVLLVDHQADLLLGIDGHATGALAVGVLAADELPLDEELAVDRLQPLDVEIEEVVGAVDAENRLAQRAFDLGAVVRAGPANERISRKVAGQADAAANDNVGLRSGAAQPFAAAA